MCNVRLMCKLKKQNTNLIFHILFPTTSSVISILKYTIRLCLKTEYEAKNSKKEKEEEKSYNVTHYNEIKEEQIRLHYDEMYTLIRRKRGGRYWVNNKHNRRNQIAYYIRSCVLYIHIFLSSVLLLIKFICYVINKQFLVCVTHKQSPSPWFAHGMQLTHPGVVSQGIPLTTVDARMWNNPQKERFSFDFISLSLFHNFCLSIKYLSYTKKVTKRILQHENNGMGWLRKGGDRRIRICMWRCTAL